MPFVQYTAEIPPLTVEVSELDVVYGHLRDSHKRVLYVGVYTPRCYSCILSAETALD
jgi:hypothetical protein